MSKIYLSSPHMGGTEQNYVQEAFHTNWIAPLGPNVNAFEQQLEEHLGGHRYVAALSSGTAALHLAMILLDVGRGDEVICQSMTFSASANPIVYQGATPVFVDSESSTWNICPERLDETILDRKAKGKTPKAIVAVHLYGMPYDVEAVHKVAQKHGIPIIEDSAEALGSTYRGQACGTFGDLSILSFNGNKIITTSGGGALVCSSEHLKEKAVFLSTQARDQAIHYQHSEIGYNYRLSNICAGIGRGQMEVLPERVSQRRTNHQFYKKLFEGHPGITLFEEPNGDYFSNHWLSCILFSPDYIGLKEQIRLSLDADQIESRPLWKPMHLQPVFQAAPCYGGSLSEDLFNRGLCLPSGSNLTDQNRERISTIISQFL